MIRLLLRAVTLPFRSVRIRGAISTVLAGICAAALAAAPAIAEPTLARHATPIPATGPYVFDNGVTVAYDFGYGFIEIEELRIDWAGTIDPGVCIVWGSPAPCPALFQSGINEGGDNSWLALNSDTAFDVEQTYTVVTGVPDPNVLRDGAGLVGVSLSEGFFAEVSVPGSGVLSRTNLVFIGVRGSDTCGDGVVDEFEFCDDGNMLDGDGCSALCATEPFWACDGEPSSCAPSEVGTMLLLDEDEFAPSIAPVTPQRIISDSLGSVYIGTSFSDVVLRRDPYDDPLIHLQPTAPVGLADLNYPKLLARHSDGTLYIGEASGDGTDRVLRYAPGGTWTVLMDASGDGGANPLGTPVDLEVDASNNLFVLGASIVFEIAPDGSSSVVLDATGDGVNAFSGSRDITLDAAGNLYVSGNATHNVFEVTPGGAVTQIIDSSANGSGLPWWGPAHMVVGPDDTLYVSTNERVLALAINGVITEVIGPAGDGAFRPLDRPGTLALGPLGRLYVADVDGDRVFEVPLAQSGTIRSIIDRKADHLGNILDGPVSLTITDPGRVYVVGSNSRNVFEITLDHWDSSNAEVPALSPLLRILLAASLAALAPVLVRRQGAPT